MSDRDQRLAVEYVIPLRWDNDDDLREFTEYVRTLSATVDVTIVDGSDDPLYRSHQRAWDGIARHLRPEPWPGRNRKVAGVVTGVTRARHESVVIADDDVRYDRDGLVAITRRLAGGDLVRPQNVFNPLPWHARWDTGRILLNRALGGDYPGTFAVRRSTFCRSGGYDGDVLFENLQMMRTIRATGGRLVDAPDLFVARRPSTVARFFDQRVRQAYDDFAQPARLAWEASWLPVVLVAALRRPSALPFFAAVMTALAEVGRRKHGGRRAFPATSSLWAPAWVLERMVCVWLAIGARLRGGVRYRGERMPKAAAPIRRAA
jgi:Glycosyl transferase family 21